MAAWIIEPALTADLPEVARLINSAYRGDESRRGWTGEAHLLGGQRTDPTSLAEDLAGPDPSVILCLREDKDGPILACVFLSKVAADRGPPRLYLGMLTVAPVLQTRGIGRFLIGRAEEFGREWGAGTVDMTVISLRAELIAWYGRRGYRATGETRPFPYGDERFGQPRQADLEFVVLEKTL